MPQQQTPAPWAKILISATLGQILVTKRTDDETGAPTLHLEADIEHLYPDYGIGGAELTFKYAKQQPNDGNYEKSGRDTTFETLTAEQAEKLITESISSFTNDND